MRLFILSPAQLYHARDHSIARGINGPAAGDNAVAGDFIHERVRIQFRAEAFNALNRTNFKVPNGNISSQGFGQVNSTFELRQLQLALKLLF
jgi:hypothetical protein